LLHFSKIRIFVSKYFLGFCKFVFKVKIMVSISDSAKNRLLGLLKNEKEGNIYVRVGVKSGGCSGLSYELSFDNLKLDEDELIEDNDIALLVNKKSMLYLSGTILEFSDGLNGKGFVFNNPNANRTCGCGESFSL
tara:strand:- start:20 stop:424 length:405 start_codon:yes stop_codon:yes gene_type:complete